MVDGAEDRSLTERVQARTSTRRERLGAASAEIAARLGSIGLALAIAAVSAAAEDPPPDTGISGVYEAMVGVDDAAAAVRYFAEFGFEPVARERIGADRAEALYNVDSALTSIRLANGDTDTHGLIRLLAWDAPLSEGVGIAPPLTPGQRLAVMRTEDIMRIHDVFADAADAGSPWVPIEPIYDDLYGATEGRLDFFNRRVGVREMAVYGRTFNHVFFQRYGYRIPGYGTVSEDAPLKTSELTHHDFVVAGDLAELTRHYVEVLGFEREAPPSRSGSWQKGPRRLFQLDAGETHDYVGFVSPNNICGKLKFFAPLDPNGDRSEQARPGHLGITLHSLYTDRLEAVHARARDHGLEPTPIRVNEFGEDSFVLAGPDGVSWQILRTPAASGAPITEFRIEEVNQ